MQRRLLEGHAGKLPQRLVAAAGGSGRLASLAWPTVTTYTLRKGSPAKTRTDLVVIGVARTGRATSWPAPGPRTSRRRTDASSSRCSASMGFRGDAGEVLRVPTAGTIKAGQLLVIGPRDRDSLTLERVAAPPVLPRATSATPPRSRWPCPRTTPSTSAPWPTASCSGGYSFTRYKSRSDDVRRRRGLHAQRRRPPAGRDHRAGHRPHRRRPGQPRPRLGEHPAERPHARALRRRGGPARQGAQARSKPKVDIEVLGRRRARRSWAAAGSSVSGCGSANPPRLVKLTWAPEDARAQVAFVGKGVTYDSGGLTIKPGSSMATMKYDMGGAAAVIAATFAIAALELPVAVTTYAPMAENMVSGRRDAPRRRADDVRRQDRRGHQHRRRGAPDPRRRARRWRPRTSPTRSSTSPR